MKPALTSAMLAIAIFFSCTNNQDNPLDPLIKEMSLKKGEVISCGPADKEYGSVNFQITGSEKVKEDFSLGLALLHSFEYDEAEKVFARVIDEDPQCAMAYWGVAMSNFHPLWAPPLEPELTKGTKAIDIARSIKNKTARETDYIEAIGAYYDKAKEADHRTRAARFEKASETVYNKYPNDKEAAIFYALSLNAAADPNDKTYAKQKKAGTILNALYPDQPNHPGVVHYIIHTYDSPELAHLGLEPARKYASIAPSSAHALHMPSHIFTRLGLWNECISSNLASVSSAQCYAQQAGMDGHWDEELHAMDYLVYAYLQKGDNEQAKKQLDHLKTITKVQPTNFKVAYVFASMPSRYVLENRLWKEASNIEPHVKDFAWNEYPWQRAIVHFTRAMGSVHENNLAQAETEIKELQSLQAKLLQQKDAYKAAQVEIQLKTAQAWLQLKKGNKNEAVEQMKIAAQLEDKTEKHPVTPGEVLPAKELLGDMLLELKRYEEALQAYEQNLAKHPNRFNGIYGAYLAAEKLGNSDKANKYKQLLLSIANQNSTRQEIKTLASN